MKIMPYMLPVFAFLVQAALGVYFIASSLYRIAQQGFIHKTMKPVTVGESNTIEAEVVEESEPVTKEVPNRRSQKAISAEEERRDAREQRSKGRRSGGRKDSPKRDASKPKKPESEQEPKPIQSKRTAGDGRTRKRRK